MAPVWCFTCQVIPKSSGTNVPVTIRGTKTLPVRWRGYIAGRCAVITVLQSSAGHCSFTPRSCCILQHPAVPGNSVLGVSVHRFLALHSKAQTNLSGAFMFQQFLPLLCPAAYSMQLCFSAEFSLRLFAEETLMSLYLGRPQNQAAGGLSRCCFHTPSAWHSRGSRTSPV